MSTATSFGSVDGLRRALRDMRTEATGGRPGPAERPARWAARGGERVVLVCGCGASAGASTVALALATVAGRSRVVETCGGTASGLVFAADSELGATERGWLRGVRGAVVIERRADSMVSPDRLPTPAASDVPFTVVDSSWEVAALLSSDGWLGELARSAPVAVLVARATIPGLRRLEAALELVGERRALAVVVGAKRWPRPVEQSAGPAVRRLISADRVITVPEVLTLATSGLTPDPLPPAILRPARALLTLLEGPLS